MGSEQVRAPSLPWSKKGSISQKGAQEAVTGKWERVQTWNYPFRHETHRNKPSKADSQRMKCLGTQVESGLLRAIWRLGQLVSKSDAISAKD